MALSRLIYRGFQPYRSGLAPLTSVDGLRRGGRLSQVPARTLFGRDRERQTKSQSRVLSAHEGKLKSIFELQGKFVFVRVDGQSIFMRKWLF